MRACAILYFMLFPDAFFTMLCQTNVCDIYWLQYVSSDRSIFKLDIPKHNTSMFET